MQGKHLSVDGSFVEANAAKEGRISREQLREAAPVHHTVRQYLHELEQQNPVEEPVHQQDQGHEPQVSGDLLATLKPIRSPMISTKANAVSEPTPGGVIKHHASGNFPTSCSIA